VNAFLANKVGLASDSRFHTCCQWTPARKGRRGDPKILHMFRSAGEVIPFGLHHVEDSVIYGDSVNKEAASYG